MAGADLDLAVARGAAYYGLVKRGKGVRIRGGTARAYYIGVATNMPAVPGFAPPIKAICVAPFGMEEGTEADIPSYEVGLRIGTEAEFRFLGSTVRRDDAAGTVVEEWEGQIDELAPVKTTLEGKSGGADRPGPSAQQGDAGRPARTVAPIPRRQAEVEAGIQRAGGEVIPRRCQNLPSHASKCVGRLSTRPPCLSQSATRSMS